MTEENTPQIIKTIGEQGEEIYMKLQEIVTINEKDYAILSIAQEDSLPTNDEDDELIVMRMNKTEDECTFEVIEDDEEFKFVVEALSDDNEDEEEIEE